MNPLARSPIEAATLNRLEERLSRVGRMLGLCEELVSHYRCDDAPDPRGLSTARALAARSAIQLSVALEEFEKLLEERHEWPENGC